ncbi:hypothetical protein WL94_13430 [Burkholderia cepacia]|uniref:hypothetical protein n=1 Tax=Burkholderia cepacia TaxID=292 RepID=UPI000757018D|nr:hypothetical protein WL94_13430 [Burkholderia cepacia]
MRNFALIPDVRRTMWRGVASLAVVLGTSMTWPDAVRADEWGCQVMLCLSNPGGPEQYTECEPPIERLWAALRHGDPFPSCDFGTGGTQVGSATNTFASTGYCREDLLVWGGPEQSELLCRATGAINVTFGNQLYTRVWWGVDGQGPTITEFYGEGSTQLAYDPAKSAAHFLQQVDRLGRENR